MAAGCFIFKWHLIVTLAFDCAEAGLIVNKIQSFAKNPRNRQPTISMSDSRSVIVLFCSTRVTSLAIMSRRASVSVCDRL